MPPIMGAGAYMMLEVVAPPVTYLQIIKAALIPAVLYYLALLLVVHLQARKVGASGAETKGTSDAEAVDKLSVARGVIFLLAMLGLVVLLLKGYSPFRSVTLTLGLVLLLSPWARDTRLRLGDMLEALSRTAKAGIPLIAAAACVGIILGVVTLTGIGSRAPVLII